VNKQVEIVSRIFDREGRTVHRKQFRRGGVLSFFVKGGRFFIGIEGRALPLFILTVNPSSTPGAATKAVPRAQLPIRAADGSLTYLAHV